MSGLIESAVDPLARSVSPLLIHSLWQGMLIAFLLKAALTMIGSQKARVRYVLASSALVAVVALCLITGLSAMLEKPLTARIGNPADSVENAVEVLPSGSVGHTMVSSAQRGDNVVFFRAPEQINRWLIPSWVGGILLLTLRHAIGYHRARRLIRNGTTTAPALWLQRFRRLCRDLGVTRPVRLRASSIVKVPCVIGWLRPVVLFPLSSLAGLSVSDAEMILAHELAHIRRNDVLINIAQIVIEILLFFNPAVWWISRQIRLEREHCCDDLAIAVSGERIAYARALINLEETRHSAPGFAVAATDAGIVARVRRIVMNEAPRTPSASMGVISMLLLCVFFIVGVATLGNHASSEAASPPTFQASDTFAPGSGDIKGDWEIETRGDWSQVSIRFKRGWQSGFSVKTSELPGVVDETTTTFLMQRGAGTFHFKGTFHRDGDRLRGEGDCYFHPDAGYVATMDSLGYDVGSAEDALELAVHDVTPAYAQGLSDLGYRDLSLSKLIEAHIHDVTPEYIAELSTLGYRNLSIDRLIEMQIHDVDVDYVRGLADLGYHDLAPERLVEMKIHDVDPDYIGALAKLGYTNLEPSRLVEMHIHDVGPDYIGALAKLGYTNLEPSRLVEMNIHDVSPDYIAGLQELGYNNLEPSRLVEMSIHDVTLSYIKEMAGLGYDDLDPSLLVEMRIHDVTPSFVKKLREKGYDDLSPRDLIDIRIHGER